MQLPLHLEIPPLHQQAPQDINDFPRPPLLHLLQEP
jgi:hypothetical protein